MREGSYIQKLIDLAKKDDKTFEERIEILNWAADVDSEKDHPLRGKVEKIYYEMTDADKDTWLARQIARKQVKSKDKTELDKPTSQDEAEMDEVTGRKIKTKSKVLDSDTLEDLDKWTKKK